MQDSNQAIALRKWLGAHGAGLVVTAAFLPASGKHSS